MSTYNLYKSDTHSHCNIPPLPSLQDSSMLDESYAEPMDTSAAPGSNMAPNESSKLPPVLANLMGNLSNSSSRSPQASNTVNTSVAPSVNVQELLSSIMVNIQSKVFCSVWFQIYSCDL